MDDSTPILHAEVVQAVSKAGKPYECIEISLGEISRRQSFPKPSGNDNLQTHSRPRLSAN